MKIDKSTLLPYWRNKLWLVSLITVLYVLFSPIILPVIHFFGEKLTWGNVKYFYSLAWALIVQDYY